MMRNLIAHSSLNDDIYKHIYVIFIIIMYFWPNEREQRHRNGRGEKRFNNFNLQGTTE